MNRILSIFNLFHFVIGEVSTRTNQFFSVRAVPALLKRQQQERGRTGRSDLGSRMCAIPLKVPGRPTHPVMCWKSVKDANGNSTLRITWKLAKSDISAIRHAEIA